MSRTDPRLHHQNEFIRRDVATWILRASSTARTTGKTLHILARAMAALGHHGVKPITHHPDVALVHPWLAERRFYARVVHVTLACDASSLGVRDILIGVVVAASAGGVLRASWAMPQLRVDMMWEAIGL